MKDSNSKEMPQLPPHNVEEVPGSMEQGDLDQASEISRLNAKIFALEVRVQTMRMNIASSIGIGPDDIKLAGALLAAIDADKRNVANPGAIAATKILKLLVETEAPIV
jgi:hypothetical protein